MSLLSSNPSPQLNVWRDSVCAGDDCDAPHEIGLTLPADASLAFVADILMNKSYLALIDGGKATWILEGRKSIAVFAQQWDRPRFLVSPTAPISSFVDSPARPNLQFKYWCQVDPETVFACLQRGSSLPDKYGAR